jgi:hypothetical protein
VNGLGGYFSKFTSSLIFTNRSEMSIKKEGVCVILVVLHVLEL